MVAIKRIMTFGLVVLGLTLINCSGQTANWYGTWEGTIDLADPSIEDDAIKNTINAVNLTIDPNDTFVLVVGGMPWSGGVLLNGDEATLTVREFMGKTIVNDGGSAISANEKITVKLQDDGTATINLESILLDDFDDSNVVLTQRPQPQTD